MNPPPTIAAAVITLNEAGNLPDLLGQLDWVDQIVVVDGRSHDGTVEIAAAAGCRVSSGDFDDFAAQRNEAVALARTDWILSIDADERLSAAAIEEIRRRMEDPRFSAYRVPIRSRIFGQRIRRSGTQDDRPIRLFRRGRGRWVGAVHERLRVEGRVGSLRSSIEHDTIPDLHAFLAKMHRYTTLEAAARTAAGRAPRWADTWLAPPIEFFRRLVWKKGALDGPAGWAFCALSGLSQWILARRHREMWDARRAERRLRLAAPSDQAAAGGGAYRNARRRRQKSSDERSGALSRSKPAPATVAKAA